MCVRIYPFICHCHLLICFSFSRADGRILRQIGPNRVHIGVQLSAENFPGTRASRRRPKRATSRPICRRIDENTDSMETTTSVLERSKASEASQMRESDAQVSEEVIRCSKCTVLKIRAVRKLRKMSELAVYKGDKNVFWNFRIFYKGFEQSFGLRGFFSSLI